MENRKHKGTNKKSFLLTALLTAGLVAAPALSWAWSVSIGVGGPDYRPPHRHHNRPPARAVAPPRESRHYAVVRTLPRGHKRAVLRGVPYHYHEGVFYRPGANGYVVVNAPLGFTLGRLPYGYLEIRIGHGSYYYHNGDYFRWDRRHQVYEVVSAPRGAAVTYLPHGYSRVNVYGETYYKFNGVYYHRERIGGEMLYVVVDI